MPPYLILLSPTNKYLAPQMLLPQKTGWYQSLCWHCTTPRIKNLDFSKFSGQNRSFARSAVILAENSNCLLDLYNARANLDFLRMFFAANFNPVQKLKNLQILSSVRPNLDFSLIFNGIRAKSKFLIMGVVAHP